MSRRIVQIAAVPASLIYEPGAGVSGTDEKLYALDNNGVVWLLEGPAIQHSKWIRLPELPNVPGLAAPTRDQLEREGSS